jgi:hypothetical protein
VTELTRNLVRDFLGLVTGVWVFVFAGCFVNFFYQRYALVDAWMKEQERPEGVFNQVLAHLTYAASIRQYEAYFSSHVSEEIKSRRNRYYWAFLYFIGSAICGIGLFIMWHFLNKGPIG